MTDIEELFGEMPNKGTKTTETDSVNGIKITNSNYLVVDGKMGYKNERYPQKVPIANRIQGNAIQFSAGDKSGAKLITTDNGNQIWANAGLKAAMKKLIVNGD